MGASGVGVCDGDREGVGGVWRRGGVESRECPDHDSDVGLAGGAAAGDGGLDGLWGVFDQRDAVSGDREDDGAAGAPERDGDKAALDVDRLFDCRARGGVGGYDFGQGIVYGEEARPQRHLARVRDHTVGEGAQSPPGKDLDDPVARAAERGVDAEDNISGLHH